MQVSNRIYIVLPIVRPSLPDRGQVPICLASWP